MTYANEHYVALFIKGKEVPSSACFSGPKDRCKAIARRMNVVKKGRRPWRVVPCVSTRKEDRA